MMSKMLESRGKDTKSAGHQGLILDSRAPRFLMEKEKTGAGTMLTSSPQALDREALHFLSYP